MVAVQIVESSVVGTRCAVLRCRRRGGGPVVVVFPMVHVATPEFYREVERRLRECDLLVVEGIIGDSAVGGALMATYKVIPANDDAGLVEDDIPYGDLGVPFVTPDMTGHEKIEVAVVYGAGHVPGILRGLYKLGYRVVSADWVMAVPAE